MKIIIMYQRNSQSLVQNGWSWNKAWRKDEISMSIKMGDNSKLGQCLKISLPVYEYQINVRVI